MKGIFAIALLPLAAQAFPAAIDPSIMADALSTYAKRAAGADPLDISKSETNCGPAGPCKTFNAGEQLVSVTGEHAYQSPAASDIRGPCPGLNAAANHAYLPRTGIATAAETIKGLGAAYGLAPDICLALAAYAIAVDGNLLDGTWSIGGPLPTEKLLGTGQGLSYSHNSYEGDASIGRDDAYLAHGDAHSLNVTKFTEVYKTGAPDDRYTLDKFRQRFGVTQQEAIATNPYFFTGLFSTVVVVPAAYNFVINLMSNHSAEEPSGYMNGYNFKQFFAVRGEPGNFKWIKGQERIPENWYRRPSDHQYHANDVLEDVLIGYLAYPTHLLYGGNTGKVDTFTGVDVNDLSGGAFNAKTLLEGDNFKCFAYQGLQQGVPQFVKSGKAQAAAANLLGKAIAPLEKALNCPAVAKYNEDVFKSYPGYSYSPTGKDQNF